MVDDISLLNELSDYINSGESYDDEYPEYDEDGEDEDDVDRVASLEDLLSLAM